MGKSVERILMNKNSGELGIGIRLAFMDKRETQEVASLPGYSVLLTPNEPDAWAIFAGDEDAAGPWLLVADPKRISLFEDLGEL